MILKWAFGIMEALAVIQQYHRDDGHHAFAEACTVK